jgi:hypothetical protein
MQSVSLFMLLTVGSLTQNAVRLPERELPEPPREAWMSKDAALQDPVTLEARGRPLRVVLASLSRQTGAHLSAARDLSEQRVSINVRRQPLARVMGRLQDLFGHGSLPSRSVYWDRAVGENRSVRYILRRTMHGRREEQAMLDAPVRITAKWLREMRDYGRLSPEMRSRYKCGWSLLRNEFVKDGRSLSEGNTGPLGEAVASLSDTQIDTLAQSGRVSLTQFTPSETARKSLASLLAESAGNSNASLQATLRLVSEGEDGGFDLLLEVDKKGLYSSGWHVDPFGTSMTDWDMEAIEAAQKKENGEEIDLLARLNAPPGKRPNLSMAAALELLSREAGIPLYAEVFLKPRRTLQVTRGKPEYLLSRICVEFGCDWRKIGGDYYVWSRSWAFDRAGDIAEPLMMRWEEALKQKGRFEFSDLLEMVQLTDRQITTLQRVLKTQFSFHHPRNRAAMRLVASLSAQQRILASGPQGVELTSPDESQQRLLQRLFERERIAFPVYLQIKPETTGVGILLRDGTGEAVPGWAYLGPKAEIQFYKGEPNQRD